MGQQWVVDVFLDDVGALLVGLPDRVLHIFHGLDHCDTITSVRVLARLDDPNIFGGHLSVIVLLFLNLVF